MGDTKLSYAQSQGTNKHQYNELGSELGDTRINSVSIYSGITRKTKQALSSQIYPTDSRKNFSCREHESRRTHPSIPCTSPACSAWMWFNWIASITYCNPPPFLHHNILQLFNPTLCHLKLPAYTLLLESNLRVNPVKQLLVHTLCN